MKIIVLERPRRSALNIRQLLNPIFYPPRVTRHPDQKRQRSVCRRDRALAAARRLKAESAYVPLCQAPPVEPPDNYAGWERTRWYVGGRQGVRGGGLL